MIQFRKDETGGARGMHEEEKKCRQGFGGETVRREITWKT
jgi:hypothetical protein